MKRLFAFAPLAILAGLLAVLAWYNFHKREKYEPTAMVGKTVPAVALTDLQDGTPAELKAIAASYGHPVLVNLFASWCEPCRGENPYLMELKNKGVTVIGIDSKDDARKALDFLAQNGSPYARTLFDPDNKAGLALGISGWPETFIVSPDGRITDKIPGPIVPDTLADVEKAVGVKP